MRDYQQAGFGSASTFQGQSVDWSPQEPAVEPLTMAITNTMGDLQGRANTILQFLEPLADRLIGTHPELVPGSLMKGETAGRPVNFRSAFFESADQLRAAMTRIETLAARLASSI
jgi:hypothetical protein